MTLATTTNQNQAAIMERVIITGDLSKLEPLERVNYYQSVCQSVGLNPLTKPFDYLTLNGKLVLYANRACADQLRSVKGISISAPQIEYVDDCIIVTVTARDAMGRTDSDLGVVTLGTLKGDARANAILKAVTKAKRRVTLSICGLGWLDETEVSTIPNAKPVQVDFETGEVVDVPTPAPREVKPVEIPGVTRGTENVSNGITQLQIKTLWTLLKILDFDDTDQSKAEARAFLTWLLLEQGQQVEPISSVKDLTAKHANLLITLLGDESDAREWMGKWVDHYEAQQHVAADALLTAPVTAGVEDFRR